MWDFRSVVHAWRAWRGFGGGGMEGSVVGVDVREDWKCVRSVRVVWVRSRRVLRVAGGMVGGMVRSSAGEANRNK